MTPAARVQAAIELLDQIIAAARDNGPPADRILAEGFRQRRYAGSKDRRAIRELVYAAIRACGPVPASGRAAMLRLAQGDPAILPLFDGSDYGPAKIGEGEPVAERGFAPAWLADRLASSGIDGAEAEALLGRAPLDLRVNSLKTSRESLKLPVEAENLAAPHGLRLSANAIVEQWEAWKEGLIEVQDCGSQLACLATGAQPGETVIDLCAGAGGKTLALAAMMDNSGTLVACDTDWRRLGQLAARAERAGAAIAETVRLDPGRELEALGKYRESADCVLVDAPCSCSGTWRRNPENRWRITPGQLQRYEATQGHLLAIAAALVKPGGRLVYVTCSLLDEEGKDRISAFRVNRPDWRVDLPQLPLGVERVNGIRLTPYRDGTDGFFIARLSRSW
ncbi:MAG TPA: RsmB/NOP family class I SAM-dependent RNA methyltransferase [Sphingomonadaceae bacterium]|nr:RsmB/NOP family class I SAM-dependent RNA methyltransferase [Sphingomonadaceae bacterium]